MICCWGQEIISVANWATDGAVRLEHCRSATFLMSVQNASLTGVLSSDNCSGAAGTLVSQGPVTLRLSAKLVGCFRYASRFAGFGCWRIRAAIRSYIANTEEMPCSTRPVRRKSGLADSNFSPLLPMMGMVVLWGCRARIWPLLQFIRYTSSFVKFGFVPKDIPVCRRFVLSLSSWTAEI